MRIMMTVDYLKKADCMVLTLTARSWSGLD